MGAQEHDEALPVIAKREGSQYQDNRLKISLYEKPWIEVQQMITEAFSLLDSLPIQYKRGSKVSTHQTPVKFTRADRIHLRKLLSNILTQTEIRRLLEAAPEKFK